MSRFYAAVRRALEVDAGLLQRVESIPFLPGPGKSFDQTDPAQAVCDEEFRTLRTRLNQMQAQQTLHTVLITSSSSGEGKSFTALNLAYAESQLEQNPAVLCDFDFRRPTLHGEFGIDRSPGISDYLLGKASVAQAIRRIGESNLFVMPAGEPSDNPVELLDRKEVGQLLAQLASVFNWIILDSPPLLYAADASLLASHCDGTILVARIGETTVDSVLRATQALAPNNILGILVNGARRGDLYAKCSEYYSSPPPAN